ncbi:MAG: hypothetical protein JO180_02565 [Gemmatirosa sp.]|nr:hypothetical protein [Gemmatirosa sp.]
MPLRATYDDAPVIAPLLTDAEWHAVVRGAGEGRALRMACCDAPGYGRVASSGLRHFAHRPGPSPCAVTHGESIAHLTAKAVAARALAAHGYAVTTEAAGDGWRADVLGVRAAPRGVVRVACEVQTSAQSLTDTLDRQERYRRAGVRALWLMSRPPAHVPSRALPIFRLAWDERTGAHHVTPDASARPAWRLSLGTFLDALLGGRLRFSTHLRAQGEHEITTELREAACLYCRAPCEVHLFRGTLRSACDAAIPPMRWRGQERAAGFAPDPSWYRLPAAIPLGDGDAPHVLKRRRHDAHGTIVRAFACPSCGAELTAAALRHHLFRRPPTRVATRRVTLTAPIHAPAPHWCLTTGAERCAGPGATP